MIAPNAGPSPNILEILHLEWKLLERPHHGPPFCYCNEAAKNSNIR